MNELWRPVALPNGQEDGFIHPIWIGTTWAEEKKRKKEKTVDSKLSRSSSIYLDRRLSGFDSKGNKNKVKTIAAGNAREHKDTRGMYSLSAEEYWRSAGSSGNKDGRVRSNIIQRGNGGWEREGVANVRWSYHMVFFVLQPCIAGWAGIGYIQCVL